MTFVSSYAHFTDKFFKIIFDLDRLIALFTMQLFRGKNSLAYGSQWRTQEKISGGAQGRGSGLVGGPGGGAPLTPENFRKFAKNSRRKLQTLLYFRLFCKEITKPCVKFSRVSRKNTTGRGNFEKILKIFDENSMKN